MLRIVKSTLILGVLTVGGSMFSTGCSSTRDYSGKDPALKVSVKVSADECVVGETVTLLSRRENTLGRDAQLNWLTTGGMLSTDDAGRVARVKFDKPGTYSVVCMLSADGREVDRSTNTITVRPLP